MVGNGLAPLLRCRSHLVLLTKFARLIKRNVCKACCWLNGWCLPVVVIFRFRKAGINDE